MEIAKILGAILKSIIDADQMVAEASIDYIKSLLTEKRVDDKTVYEPQYISIDIPVRRIGGDGVPRLSIQRLRVPLLTLVNIPYIGIEEAKIDVSMDLYVKTEGGGLNLVAIPTRRVRKEEKADIDISITLKRRDILEGYSQLYTQLLQGIYQEGEYGGEG